MKKYISLMAFCLLAVFSQVLVSCSDDDADKKSNANGYKVDLPSGTSGVKIEPLSDEEVNKLKAQGYKIVGTPVNVTQDGKDHVVLKEMATVSFKIPEDFPKEQYNELVAVLITDEGPEYIIPDLEALNEGYVTFKTIHFCKALTVQDKERLNDEFSEYVGIHDWNNNLREETFNKLGDKLKESIDKAGFSENDLLGITMREVLGSNDYVNTTMEYIKHYDNGNLKDNAINDISEKVYNDLMTKALSVLFTKLKKEPNNKAVKECLEKYMTQENMEKAGTLLGSESPATVALEFAKDFAVNKMKDFITSNPYVKAFVVAAEVEIKAIDIFHKFWARTDMNYYYKKFEEYQNGNDNPDTNWELIEYQLRGASEFEFGMTLDEMKEMFKKRYYDRKKINAKKAEVLKLIDLWDQKDLLLNLEKEVNDTYGDQRRIKEYFTKTIDSDGKQKDDYCMRLTRLYNLMERFRKELVVNGYLKGYNNANNINEELAYIVYQYITIYPDEKAFYKWLVKEGYIDKKLEKNVDDLEEMRSWYLIRTDINKREDEDNGMGYVRHYFASETEHSYSGTSVGRNYESYSVGFKSSIETPLPWIEGGDSIVLHTTIKRTSSAYAYAYVHEDTRLTFEDESIGMNFSSDWAVWGEVRNLKGSTTVGISPDDPDSGEWDYVIHIPSGRKKNELRALNFNACGSRTHWVYRWCSIFEKDEQ